MNILHRPAIKDMEMKSIVLTLVLFLAAYIVNAQSVQRVYGSDCTGATNVFVYNGSSCTSYNWYISSGGTIISGQGTASIQVKWNSATSSAHVSVNYSCSSYPYSGTSYSSTYSISNPITPSVSITSNLNNVCPGTNVTFTASPSNAGNNPYYNWQVNGSTVSSGTSSTFSRNNLNHGDVVRAIMSVNSSGCYSSTTATSNLITMSLITPAVLGVSVSGPSVICSGSTGPSFYASVTNGGTSLSYQWYKNGVLVNDNATGIPAYVYAPQNALVNGDRIKCRVTSNGTCVTNNPAESSEYTVSVTSSVTPTVGVTIPHYSVCDQATINFSASSSYFTGGSTYSWRLNGAQFSTTPTTSLQVSADGSNPSHFGPGDVVTVYVTALSGTCLTQTTATGTTNGVPWVFNSLPNAGTTPSGNYTFASGVTQSIAASSGANYSYRWFANNNAVPAPGGTANPYIASASGAFKVEVTGPGGCKKTSPTVYLTRNTKPTANAGPDQTITLPANTITLNGSGSDAEGPVTYQWTKVSGPDATLTNANTANVTISWMGEGEHVFRLKVTDNFPENATDDVKVTVKMPPNNYNWIRTTTIQVPGITNSAQATSLAIGLKMEVVGYFDGLGRPIQSVTTQASPAGKDIVQPHVYDEYGRQPIKYLPYTDGTNGYFKSDFIAKDEADYSSTSNPQFRFYNGTAKVATDSKPFSETIFEASPLNRPLQEYGAGNTWSSSGDNKYVQYEYLINVHGTGSGQEKIICWQVNASGLPIRANAYQGYVEAGGYYSDGQLQVKATKDEEGNQVREYTDKQGRVILKKVPAVAGAAVNNHLHWAMTYYIYDDLGNLRLVLQPELSKLIHNSSDTYVVTATNLNAFAFQYIYDSRRRMSQKRVPGAEWVYMVYDQRDRVILTQDGKQRSGSPKYWTFTKYDALNRPVATGIKDTTATLTQMQMQEDVVNFFYQKPWTRLFEQYVGAVSGNIHGYTNKSYPVITAGTAVNINSFMTVTYYDTYNYLSLWTGNYGYTNENLVSSIGGITYTQPTSAVTAVVGQITGVKTKVLDGGVMGWYSWLKTVNYYDEKYRVIQTISDNYKGGEDRTTNLYDFAGKVLKARTSHVQRDIVWKDVVGTSVVGMKLTRTASGSSWGAAGAASEQVLSAGQDGWMEVTVDLTSTQKMIGFNDTNPNATYTNINYALYLNGTNLQVYENGTNRGIKSTLLPGDVLRIERTGTTVRYKRNGSVIFTSTLSSSTALMVDASIYTTAAAFVNVRTSFGSSGHEVTRRFEYDHAGSRTKGFHQVGSGNEVLLSQNEYNELGQLVDKKLHSVSGSAPKQSVDYRYNIRGWLTSMNNSTLSNDGATNDDSNDYFGFELGYNQSIGAGNSPLYNGNISGIKWSNNLGLGTLKEKAYVYDYDPMNRIEGAAFKEKKTAWGSATNGGYSANNYNYDLNGNITGLLRHDERGSTTAMDNLVYTYSAASGNRLLKVVDSGDKLKGFVDGTNTGDDYSYDANGNMITDQNKGITTAISYNFLNLPEVVTKGGNSIRYVYDASGRKLSQITSFGSRQKQTDYVGEFQYENDQLQSIQHEEGRIVMAQTEMIYLNSGEGVADYQAVNTNLSVVTENGGEKYVKAVSSSTTARSGIASIGGVFGVVPGERYRIKIKGYRHKGTSASSNPVYISIKGNGADLNWPGAALQAASTTAQTESWAEQVVTVPSGVSLLTVGLNWSTVTVGEAIYVNEVEIVKETPQNAEYHYHLKDHLGNVRLTFTSKEEVDVAIATMETVNESQEQGEFLYYDEAIKVNHELFDHTYNGTTGATYYSTRLTGASSNAIFGLAKSISVMPGDVVKAAVWAKYLDTNTANYTTALQNFLASIAAGTAPAGTVLDGGSPGSLGGSTYPVGTINHSSETGAAPKAYLNWIVFKRDMLTVVEQGFYRITTNAREYGQNCAHDKLFKDLIINEPGYVYIYLSNENPTLVEVFFDDFWVEHIKSPVVQMDDYYPFGLTFNSYSRENSVENKVKFQGQEHIDDLNLGWDSFKWRNHQPDIARFFNVDPIAEEYYYNSPYTFSENKVVAHIELEGLEAIPYLLPRPLILPRVGPIPLPPGEIVIPPTSTMNVPPNANVGRPTAEATNKTGNIDWNNPPSSPDELGEGWEETTDSRNKSGSRDFRHTESKEEVRWDPGKEGKPGWEGKNHWHRNNPEKTGNKDYYLDKEGNPVPRGSGPSHLEAPSLNFFQKSWKELKEWYKKDLERRQQESNPNPTNTTI